MYSDDFFQFFDELSKHEVRYMIVGGIAVNFHGYKRTTGDIDLWVEDSFENRSRLISTFKSMGYGNFSQLADAPFLPGFCEIMMDSGIYIDLLDRVYGFIPADFDMCYQKAMIQEYQGVQMRIIGLEQLRHSKAASNRPKDKLDFDNL